MALPLAPVAGFALRYGAVALAAYTLSRKVHAGRVDQRAEDAMDDVEEGLSLRRARDREQMNGAARFHRVIRVGSVAVEVDATAMGRLRVRRLSE